ncbi:hypothetical protein FHR32_005079 [Streptosporangium album]|uniref:Uncharacterized protein n=1 Tax=Streptosporangium album TaxID=47479 RepID=A0A7W7RZB3_9ACTN|nr:hypothetical protein [Streptosporangium album]MBB4940702.1 hypothetical protein [Streptosporangium album]
MRTNKASDQLVAPVPTTPAWPNDEVRQTVTQNNQAAYYRHFEQYKQRGAAARKLTADCDQLSREVADAKRVLDDAQHRYDEKVHAQRVEAHYEQVEYDTAQGYAVACASLGAPVPPPDGELSHDADGKTARWSAAVDEQNAAEGVRGL